jgi:geranylgeranyl pyrophosphate synthase
LQKIKRGAEGKDLDFIISFVRAYGGTEYAVQKAEAFSTRAIDCLKPLPESPAKQSLVTFVRYVMERAK